MRPFTPSQELRRAGLAALAACAAIALATAGVAAETVVTIPLPCMSTEEFEAFKERHAEGLVAFGVTSTGALVQRIEGPEGGWTLVLVVQSGLYCALATGEGWHAMKQAVPDPET